MMYKNTLCKVSPVLMSMMVTQFPNTAMVAP